MITVESNNLHSFGQRRRVLAKADSQFSRAAPTEHQLSPDKLMACMSRTNLASAKKFPHEDPSAITKGTPFSRAVREER